MIKIKVKDPKNLAELIYRSGCSISSLSKEVGLSDTTIHLLIIKRVKEKIDQLVRDKESKWEKEMKIIRG